MLRRIAARCAPFLVVQFLFLAPISSLAAEPSALAETLFRRGKAAMEAGRFEEACADLRESLRLDAAGGTQLTLAVCYEKAGKYATAWLAYLDALSFAQRDGRADREKLAREKATMMEQLAPHVFVRVDESVSGLPDVTIFLDGTALERSGWDTDLAVDPGKHTVTVRAKGHREWSTEFTVRDAADRAEVSIPKLEQGSREPANSSDKVGVIATEAAGSKPPINVPCPRCTKPTPPPPPTRAIIAAASGGAGLALLATGIVFGVSAAVRASEVCDQATCPTSQQGAYDYYRMSATTANVTVGLGVALTGLSAILFFTGGSTAAR